MIDPDRAIRDMMPETDLSSISPKNILVPRFDTLGDMVLLEGFLEALLQQFPEAKVTLFARRVTADLSCLFPERLDWIITDIDPYSQPPDESLCSKLIENISAISPDLVLVTAHNRTWADNLIAAKAKESTITSKGFAIGRWTEMPLVYQKFFEKLGLSSSCPYERTIPVLKKSHEVAKYQVFAGALVGNSALPEPKLYVNEHQRRAAENILQSMDLQGKKFFLCSPAGIQKVAIKTWPPDLFAEIISWLELERGVRCLVTGHRSEAGCVEAVARLAKGKGAQPQIWLGREGDIPLLAALLEAARFYLGNDTGPMHMAAAVGTPVIGIFGGGQWTRFAPMGAKSIAIIGEMSCFGCAWDCIFGDAPCVKLVTVNDVKAAVDLIQQDDTHGPRILEASGKISAETDDYIKKAIKTHREVNQDRLGRLEANMRLEKLLKESEVDRDARLAEINKLSRQLAESEADRETRLAEINKLSRQLAESEADRETRLAEMEKLGRLLAESEADRAARLAEINRLGKLLAESEADRAARLTEMNRLGKLIEEIENQLRDAHIKIEDLQSVRNNSIVRLT